MTISSHCYFTRTLFVCNALSWSADLVCVHGCSCMLNLVSPWTCVLVSAYLYCDCVEPQVTLMEPWSISQLLSWPIQSQHLCLQREQGLCSSFLLVHFLRHTHAITDSIDKWSFTVYCSMMNDLNSLYFQLYSSSE